MHRRRLGDLDGDPPRIHALGQDEVRDPCDRVGLRELPRRQVEPDLQLDALCAPGQVLPADSSTTHLPIASISPISSASGMNSPGGTSPPVGSVNG